MADQDVEDDDLHESNFYKEDEGITSCCIFKTKPIGITTANIFICFWLQFVTGLVLTWNTTSQAYILRTLQE